ncbi:MAG: glycosyltransferase family 2 protein [Gaiellaceae bacterium]
MKIVQTLLVRDEADIIDAHLAYHLNHGVDFVIATDHDSQDGTTEILETYARDGYVRRTPESGAMREVKWRTRMARIAFVEHGADWVINADADQFWWPRRGDLRDILRAIPTRFGAIRAFDRVFIPRPDDGAHFAERMTHRMSAPAAINAPVSTYRPLARVIHRGDPGVVVSLGNHAISGTHLTALQNWHPIEVLHFPWRSPAQMAQKARHFVEAGSRHATVYHVEAHRAVVQQRLQDHYASLAVDDRAFEIGIGEGAIVTDTRLRDVLRILAGSAELRERGGQFSLPPTSAALPVQHPTPQDDAAYAAEAAALRDADTVRACRAFDRLERRVRALERRTARGLLPIPSWPEPSEP